MLNVIPLFGSWCVCWYLWRGRRTSPCFEMEHKRTNNFSLYLATDSQIPRSQLSDPRARRPPTSDNPQRSNPISIHPTYLPCWVVSPERGRSRVENSSWSGSRYTPPMRPGLISGSSHEPGILGLATGDIILAGWFSIHLGHCSLP